MNTNVRLFKTLKEKNITKETAIAFLYKKGIIIKDLLFNVFNHDVSLKNNRLRKEELIVEAKRKYEKNENLLTEEWWNDLSEEWKDYMLFNIDNTYMSAMNGGSLYSYYSNYNYAYKRTDKYNITKTLFLLSKIKIIYIDPFVLKNSTRGTIMMPTKKIDFTPLSCLQNIEELFLVEVIGNLTFLSKLGKIKTLYFNSTPFGEYFDLKPLSYLKNIKTLTLRTSTNSLEPLSNLKSLTRLELRVGTLDLNPISVLPKLTHLNLEYNMGNISMLSNLDKLKYLNLSFNEQDLTPISSLTELETLILTENKENLVPLFNLKKLNQLVLSDSVFEFKDINTNSSITRLDLTGTRIKGLSYLVEYYPNLEELIIEIVDFDLSPFSMLTKLTKLELKLFAQNNTEIVNGLEEYVHCDITPLGDLSKLKYLSFEYLFEDEYFEDENVPFEVFPNDIGFNNKILNRLPDLEVLKLYVLDFDFTYINMNYKLKELSLNYCSIETDDVHAGYNIEKLNIKNCNYSLSFLNMNNLIALNISIDFDQYLKEDLEEEIIAISKFSKLKDLYFNMSWDYDYYKDDLLYNDFNVDFSPLNKLLKLQNLEMYFSLNGGDVAGLSDSEITMEVLTNRIIKNRGFVSTSGNFNGYRY